MLGKPYLIRASVADAPGGDESPQRGGLCPANAVDAAIKLCKTATGRGEIISFQGGFHGSSTAAMALTGLVDQKSPVQNGCGRTGTWFAFEQYGIEPDVIVASKALSGMGLPVAMIMYDKALDQWQPGAHAGTFRGNQLAFAAGAAAVRIIRRDDVLGNVRRRNEQVAARLSPLADNPWVREVRGRGLMWGIELADPDSGKPAGALAKAVQARALNRGLILECGGRDDCVLRMLPPLNVSPEVIEIGCGLLLETIEEQTAQLAARTADAPGRLGTIAVNGQAREQG